MTTLRTQMQLTRINRTRHRIHAWWHANHCAKCAEKRGDPAAPADDELPAGFRTFEVRDPAQVKALLQQFGIDLDGEADTTPKAH